MKIIHRGQIPSDRIWHGLCRACGSTAEAVETEMTHITDNMREGGRFSWEKCPVCQKDDQYGGMLFYPKKD